MRITSRAGAGHWLHGGETPKAFPLWARAQLIQQECPTKNIWLMNRSTTLVTLIWILVLASSFFGASETMAPVPEEFSPGATLVILAMPILLFGAMPFWARHSPFFHPVVARYVDARFGEGVLASFLVRLKPLLLFAVSAAIQGGLGLSYAARANSPSGAYVLWGFFISGAVGFTLAHILLYSRRATGVYPAERLSGEDRLGFPMPERKPLKEALRVYWKSLIGIAIFPALALVGGDFLHIPFEFVALLFFAVCLLAAWPFLSGNAPITFWLVAMAVYLGGGVLAALLGRIVRVALA